MGNKGKKRQRDDLVQAQVDPRNATVHAQDEVRLPPSLPTLAPAHIIISLRSCIVCLQDNLAKAMRTRKQEYDKQRKKEKKQEKKRQKNAAAIAAAAQEPEGKNVQEDELTDGADEPDGAEEPEVIEVPQEGVAAERERKLLGE